MTTSSSGRKSIGTRETAAEREAKLRKRYGAAFCVCGRPKRMREPFCKADMGVLGSAGAPRPLLAGALDDAQTAKAWEDCLAVLVDGGWVKEGTTL